MSSLFRRAPLQSAVYGKMVSFHRKVSVAERGLDSASLLAVVAHIGQRALPPTLCPCKLNASRFDGLSSLFVFLPDASIIAEMTVAFVGLSALALLYVRAFRLCGSSMLMHHGQCYCAASERAPSRHEPNAGRSHPHRHLRDLLVRYVIQSELCSHPQLITLRSLPRRFTSLARSSPSAFHERSTFNSV